MRSKQSGSCYPIRHLIGLLLLAFSLSSSRHIQAQTDPIKETNQICGLSIGSTSGEPILELQNDSEVHEYKEAESTLLCIKPDQDPYSRVYWSFRFSKPLPIDWSSFVLEIEYSDHGAGVIEPEILTNDSFAGAWSKPQRCVSYTRLNTHQVRKAVFQFGCCPPQNLDTIHPHLRIAGLQYLRSITLRSCMSDQEWTQAISSIPTSVTPMVSLKHPMEMVTTAGVPVHGTPDSLKGAIDNIHELAPLARVLGFTSIEVYIPWDQIEPRQNEFDFSYFDNVALEVGKYGLKLFPLLIVGSAYALPEWFKQSGENAGFVCLEHGLSNPIQSIWSPYHKKHVTRVLQALGRHYEPMEVFEGVRLGPSGNYGESQYPAGGNWGYKSEKMHIHIGYWAGDQYAIQDFQNYLSHKYGSLASLNQAWQENFNSFSLIRPLMPPQYQSLRARIDMTDWYTRSMTDWCEWWASEARQAMPNTKIYQSSGGWGFREAGTDFVAQARSMKKTGGGIRMTNETDSLTQNIYVNRLAATAARLYDIPLGYEPASSHTARGVTGRLFTTITTNAEHFFTYHPNLFTQPGAIDHWLRDYPMLDNRQKPLVEVALYYPETMNQLDDGAFRELYAWGFYPRAAEIRRRIEVDHLDESLLREGFLDQYKVLVLAWGNIIEADVLAVMDTWLRKGGTIIYPSFPRGSLATVEGDTAVFEKWEKGDTGQGSFYRFPGDMEPPSLYADYVKRTLVGVPGLHPWTRLVLDAEHPGSVYLSVQADGYLMAINYSDQSAHLQIGEAIVDDLKAYSMARYALPQCPSKGDPQ